MSDLGEERVLTKEDLNVLAEDLVGSKSVISDTLVNIFNTVKIPTIDAVSRTLWRDRYCCDVALETVQAQIKECLKVPGLPRDPIRAVPSQWQGGVLVALDGLRARTAAYRDRLGVEGLRSIEESARDLTAFLQETRWTNRLGLKVESDAPFESKFNKVCEVAYENLTKKGPHWTVTLHDCEKYENEVWYLELMQIQPTYLGVAYAQIQTYEGGSTPEILWEMIDETQRQGLMALVS